MPPIRPGSVLAAPAPPLPELVHADETSKRALASAVRAGRLVRLRRGVYVHAADIPADRFDARDAHHLALVASFARRLPAHACVSHGSAALVWGLPTAVQLSAVHVTGVRADFSVPPPGRRHIQPVPGEQRAVVGGIAVTSLARTAVDCARTMAPAAALVVVDAALRAGADGIEMLAINAGLRSPRFRRRAEQLIRLGDAGAESPMESRTRYWVTLAGVPDLVTQHPVRTRSGVYYLDIASVGIMTGYEYDGEVKYANSADSLLREKRREDELRTAGWHIVRITKRDYANVADLIAGLRRQAIANGAQLAPVSPHLSVL